MRGLSSRGLRRLQEDLLKRFIVMSSCQFGTKAVAYVELRMAGSFMWQPCMTRGPSLVSAGLGSRSVFVDGQ